MMGVANSIVQGNRGRLLKKKELCIPKDYGTLGLLRWCLVHSFKSPAIAEDIAGYSCLRLVKLRAISRYISI
jgi:hypothetical protein